MDLPGATGTSAVADLATVEAAHRRLVEQTRQLRAAAETWGLRHDTPEGSVLSGLIGSLAEMGSLTVGATAAISAQVEAFGADLDRRRQAAQDSADQVAVAARDAGEFVGKLRMAVDRAELVKKDMPARVAALLAADVGRALRAPLEAKLRWEKRSAILRHWMLAGVATLGLFVAGVVVGRVERQPSLTEMQVDWCEEHPLMAGGKGYCELDRLRPLWREGRS